MTEYVTKQIAQIAKEKGFNEHCVRNIWGYDEYESFTEPTKQENWTTIRLNTPTYSQLIDWIFTFKNKIDYKEVKGTNGLIHEIAWVKFWYDLLINEMLDLKTWNVIDIINLAILNELILTWFNEIGYHIEPKLLISGMYECEIKSFDDENDKLNIEHIGFKVGNFAIARHFGILKTFSLLYT